MKKIRIRCPVPKKEDLKRSLIATAKTVDKSVEENVNFYIRCRLKDIEEENIKIIKANMTIEKLKKCIEIAEEIKAEVRE